MRVGLFGGTFDPPHLGHLIMAERCREEARLDAVWFLVSFKPPHKLDQVTTAYDQRLAMVQLAITGHPHFRAESIERDLPPPSYTVETLRVLIDQHPDSQFHLILGGDSVSELPTWYQPQTIVRRAGIIAVPRPGSPSVTHEQLARSLNVPVETFPYQVVASPLIDLASREIRRRVRDRQSIRYLVPDPVAGFIDREGLYRA